MIGAYIRQLREDKGFILRQMAAMLDVDPTILSKMEREERPFKKENIIKVAEICSHDKDELLTVWLADKVLSIVHNEAQAASAIDLAKHYLNNKNEKI